jgi:hypothetical protein
VRRHARGRRNLSPVRLFVGSGGVLRHGAGAGTVLDAVLGDVGGGWAVPADAAQVVDADYVLAPAGLLAGEHPAAAAGLVGSLLRGWSAP